MTMETPTIVDIIIDIIDIVVDIYIYIYGGVHNGGYPKWMVFLVENPNLKWMIWW